jgi:hydroxyethylthiazole kinase-like uncharacterized protein yjeF
MHQSHRGDQRADAPPRLDAALLRSWPLPLDEHGDKLTRGTVLVIAGSTTTAGAALLAGTAALRMGAGRLQIATVAPISMGVSIAMPEAMVLPLAVNDEGELLAGPAEQALGEQVAEAQAILVGPGMSGPGGILAIVNAVCTQMSPEAILVVDAAALYAISSANRDATRSVAEHLVLTPNRDELNDLVDALAVDADADNAARAVSEELGAAITCFGDVTSFDGRQWRAADATPGLGTSGSGDVLAGLVAGAAARCGDPAQAACWGTYVHAVAGDRLSERLGTMSFIARELLDEVPHVLATLD